MARDITDRDTATAAVPMSPTITTAVASGSGSVSGMGTAGGFGAFGFAADPFMIVKSRPAFPNRVFGDACKNGFKKTFFQPSCGANIYRGIDRCSLFSETASFEMALSHL